MAQALFNGSEPAWADDAVARLRTWGFNTLGGYSSGVAEAAAGRQGVYYNKLLMFATRFAMPNGTPLEKTTKCGCFAYDVFSDAFAAASDTYARANVLPRAEDPWLLGWHFEKEVSWSKMDLRWWFHPALAPELAAGAANATQFLKGRWAPVSNAPAHPPPKHPRLGVPEERPERASAVRCGNSRGRRRSNAVRRRR